MLDRDGQQLAAAELILALPCRVELPPQLRENFEKVGPVASSHAERRRFPRVYCRGKQNRAALQNQGRLPGLSRTTEWQSVYLSNISRDGIAFIHSESLFPCERVSLLLVNARVLSVDVVCCHRVGPRCYEIGARITGRGTTTATAEMAMQQSGTSASAMPASDGDWIDESGSDNRSAAIV